MNIKLELDGVGENLSDHTLCCMSSYLLDLCITPEFLPAGVSFELDPAKEHKTFDVFRNVDAAKEQARLRYGSLVIHSSLISLKALDCRSIDEDNMHRYGISALAYLPLNTVSPDEERQIIAGVEDIIQHQVHTGKLPVGLAKQYEAQLRLLKDASEPDLELAAVTGHMSPRCMYSNPPKLRWC